MKLLLDECVTRHVKRDFVGHVVFTVDDAGFKGLKNGELLRAAANRFDAIVTVDRKLPIEQKTAAPHLTVLLLIAKSNRYEALKPLIPLALDALQSMNPGDVREIRLLQLLR